MKKKLTTAKIPNKQYKQHTTSVKPEEQWWRRRKCRWKGNIPNAREENQQTRLKRYVNYSQNDRQNELKL